MAYGKGRAIGYTDYYKNNDSTPDDRESETNDYRSIAPKQQSITDMSAEDKKKMAIRRRLQKLKAGK